jgi:hypothetical protein
MNQLYLYLYADVPATDPGTDEAKSVVIGDIDTREPARHEDADALILSLI